MGARIREARQGTGLSQLAFAKDLQVGERTVQAWELNERHPRHAAMLRIAARTRQPVSFFYTANGEAA